MRAYLRQSAAIELPLDIFKTDSSIISDKHGVSMNKCYKSTPK